VTVPLISARIAGFFRLARFEQVRNTRQTTGDVACLGGFLRDTGNNVTHAHLHRLATPIRRLKAGSTAGIHWYQAAAYPYHLHPTSVTAGRISLAAAGRSAGSITVNVGQTGQLRQSDDLTVNAFFHIGESSCTAHFGNDRVGVRIPLGYNLPDQLAPSAFNVTTAP
jgi:hypothetical protein